MPRISVESDGTWEGTRVLGDGTYDLTDAVQRIEWELDRDGRATARLYISAPNARVTADVRTLTLRDTPVRARIA